MSRSRVSVRSQLLAALVLAAACAEEHNASVGSGDGTLGGERDDGDLHDAATADRPADAALVSHDGGSAPDADHARTCRELDLRSCEGSAPTCQLRNGRLVDTSRRCIGGIVLIACDRRVLGGDDALGYGRDAEGRVWQFSSMSLVPSNLERVYESETQPWGGWPLCRPFTPQPNMRCSELSTSACESELGCVAIRGVQYDPERKCRWEGSVIVGCTQADMPCPPSIVHARYPGSSEAFEIASGCLPAKFEQVEYPGDLQSFALCPAN